MMFIKMDYMLFNRLKKPLSAFSLIELSIVLIIIGLIIVGVLNGQKMISLARLTSARTLTNSSPVNDIENLLLWLETTSKSSINANQRVDGKTVTIWYDINPQHIPKYDFTASQSPTYDENAINHLPALALSPNDRFESSVSIFNPATDDFTIFAVAHFDGTNHEPLISIANGNTDTLIGYHFSNKFISSGNFNGSAITGPLVDTSEAEIYRITHDTDNTKLIFSINGGTETQKTGTPTNGTDVWRIGADNNLAIYFSGSIGEIIVFNRILSPFEIDQIEEYLSKKWKIDLD